MPSNNSVPKLSKKTSKILNFLRQWQAQKHLYDLEHFHSMEFYDGEWLDILGKGYFHEEELATYSKDRFWGFAVDGAGGEYVLRYSPELEGEPPVVFLGSEGEIKMLAANMEDFLNRIADDITFCAGWIWQDASPDEIQEELVREYDDLADFYEEAHGVVLSEKEVAHLLQKERKAFKEVKERIL